MWSTFPAKKKPLSSSSWSCVATSFPRHQIPSGQIMFYFFYFLRNRILLWRRLCHDDIHLSLKLIWNCLFFASGIIYRQILTQNLLLISGKFARYDSSSALESFNIDNFGVWRLNLDVCGRDPDNAQVLQKKNVRQKETCWITWTASLFLCDNVSWRKTDGKL
jgi:hypothetical protein